VHDPVWLVLALTGDEGNPAGLRLPIPVAVGGGTKAPTPPKILRKPL